MTASDCFTRQAIKKTPNLMGIFSQELGQHLNMSPVERALNLLNTCINIEIFIFSSKIARDLNIVRCTRAYPLQGISVYYFPGIR
jgi:hypothetical protein